MGEEQARRSSQTEGALQLGKKRADLLVDKKEKRQPDWSVQRAYLVIITILRVTTDTFMCK